MQVLEYNTQLEKIKLHEYGRNVQQMVDHCKTIEDRDQRNHCAKTIINVMRELIPEIKNDENLEYRLWDYLAILSDFELDVDYPFPIVQAEELTKRPEHVEYKLENIRFRHYGKIIEKMILRTAEYPDGEEKDALIFLIANHMKKLMFAISKEGVEDEKILNDLKMYSRGKIDLDPATYKLRIFTEEVKPQSNNKKKKKK